MTIYNDEVSSYIKSLFAQEDRALQQVRTDTPKRGLPAIHITAEEGRFLQFLVRACGAQKVLEIGTLGGYSGIWIARGLTLNGKLITLEINPVHAEIAAEHFALAGVDDRVDIRVGDAHQTLRQLTNEEPFDFIFIDADKTSYPDYFEWALEHTRPGAIIAAHNAFGSGAIIGGDIQNQYTALMGKFNRRLAHESHLISTIFPAGDGTLVAVKTD
jgi:caffeoyl-CoA O-methyltransferase